MVQRGVGYYYVLVCIFQVAWTFSFSYEIICLSLVFILLIWVSLCALVYTQYTIITESSSSRVEFWFFQFPFAMHCGWLTAASVVNANVVVVYRNASASVQLAVGIVSLAYLHAVSVWILFGLERNPNYTIAGVLAWANGWIYAELSSPSDTIVALFDADTISGVSYAAAAVAYIITGQIVVRFVMHVVANYTNRKDTTEEEQQQQEQLKSLQGSEDEQELVDATF